jgi:hypothetical protein
VFRNKILDAALSHVDNLGWTTDALAQAIKENNHHVIMMKEPSSPNNTTSEKNGGPLLHGIFDRGAYDLVHHFLEKKRQHVLNTATVEVRIYIRIRLFCKCTYVQYVCCIHVCMYE